MPLGNIITTATASQTFSEQQLCSQLLNQRSILLLLHILDTYSFSTRNTTLPTTNYPSKPIPIMLLKALLAATALISSTAAECQMGTFGSGHVETNTKLCVPQGEGDWTFGMATHMVSVPGGTAGDGLAGAWGGAQFTIYDNSCTVQGAYTPCKNGIPYFVQENWMPYTLSVNTVDMGVGSPYFSFTYGDGKYSIKNNQCGCQKIDQGAGVAAKACKCAFPVDGTFGKKREAAADAEVRREVEFKA